MQINLNTFSLKIKDKKQSILTFNSYRELTDYFTFLNLSINEDKENYKIQICGISNNSLNEEFELIRTMEIATKEIKMHFKLLELISDINYILSTLFDLKELYELLTTSLSSKVFYTSKSFNSKDYTKSFKVYLNEESDFSLYPEAVSQIKTFYLSLVQYKLKLIDV